MTFDRSEAGRVSTFDAFTNLLDELSFRGDGYLYIDEGSDPEPIAWHPIASQTSKPNSSELILERLGLRGGWIFLISRLKQVSVK